MDFKKILDQTVRELKREVNKTILKVPEIEQKVLDATSNEPWGPHGTLMAEIAQATRNHYELQMIMAVLWKRLSDTGCNWRHVYKALTVLEYLVAHGSERVIDDINQHAYQIALLADFQYVEPNGKDQGINVRKKAATVSSTINNKEKIRELRQKAADNKDKYGGISSMGGISKAISYQSTRGSYDRDGYTEDNYGRHGMQDDRYSKDRDLDRDDEFYGTDGERSGRAHNDTDDDLPRKPVQMPSVRTSGPPSYEEASQSPERELKYSIGQSVSLGHASTQAVSIAFDDFDDFNPRATSGAAPSLLVNTVNQSEPSAPERGSSPSLVASSLFGDTTDFFGERVSSSSTPLPPLNGGENLVGNPSLRKAHSGSSSSAGAQAVIKPPPSYVLPSMGNGVKASVPASAGIFPASVTQPPTIPGGSVVAPAAFDLFAPASSSANQAAKFELGGDDFFGLNTLDVLGSVSSSAGESASMLKVSQPPLPASSGTLQATHSFAITSLSNPWQPFQGTSSKGQPGNTRPQEEKHFETKSAVWADGLSKGLIDLNLAGPKSNSLADIGICFDQLGTERMKDERMPTGKSTASTGRAMGSGSGLGVAGASMLIAPQAPAALNNMGMAPMMGMGGMGMGAGMRPMMRPAMGMGPAAGPGIGMGLNPTMANFPNQPQQYGGSR